MFKIRRRSYIRCSCGKKFYISDTCPMAGAQSLAILHVVAWHAWQPTEAPAILTTKEFHRA
jgi:hypothetical protein